VANPTAFEVGRAGLVVVLSSHAVKEACAQRGWSLSELARRGDLTTNIGERLARPTSAVADSLESCQSAGARRSDPTRSTAEGGLEMEDGRAIGARDLILAVFRLAVADYLGVWYGHERTSAREADEGRLPFRG